MKNVLFLFLLTSSLAFFNSCEKDEGKLPDIDFKTGGAYVSSDQTIAAGSSVLVGITAAKTEDEDVLKKFTVSESINGAAATTVYTQDLTGAEGDNFSFDFTITIPQNSSGTAKYTFTVTNRDGLVNQVSLTLTVKSPPVMSFKSGGVYVSTDLALAPTSVLIIGINASKSGDDLLKKFTVTKSVNGGAATTVFTQDLSGADTNSYSHDFTEIIAGSAGSTIKYTFTITSEAGLAQQSSITITVS